MENRVILNQQTSTPRYFSNVKLTFQYETIDVLALKDLTSVQLILKNKPNQPNPNKQKMGM